MKKTTQPLPFRNRDQIEQYFSGVAIQCLLCRRTFQRLAGHLMAKHEMSADDYRERFGLPWSRGLISSTSATNAGWSEERKEQARFAASKSRFFERAHLTKRRDVAPFLREESLQRLVVDPRTLTADFTRSCGQICRGAGFPLTRKHDSRLLFTEGSGDSGADDERRVGIFRTFPRAETRASAAQSSVGSRRGVLDDADGRAVAGFAGGVGRVEFHLASIPPLGGKRRLGRDPGGPRRERSF
jgi:ROS/MUCR transcriptional regulator protein